MPKVVRIGDTCACSDPAVAGSPDVFVNGIPVHRVGDGTGGHSSWVPNAAATGSPDVFVNGIPVVRVSDFHIGHASPTPNPFHRTPYVTGSPDTIVN